MPRRPHGSIRRAGGGSRRDSGGGDDGQRAPFGGRETHNTPDGDFFVRSVPGAAARKDYRCPGCQQQIRSGTPHVVAWPADDPSWVATAVDARRHWHRGCWDRWSTKGGPRAG